MTIDNSYITADLGTGIFSAESVRTGCESLTSELALLAGGYDRRLLGVRRTLTLEGKYLISKQGAFFRSLIAALESGAAVTATVGTDTYTGYYPDKAFLTERDGEPCGSFSITLCKL